MHSTSATATLNATPRIRLRLALPARRSPAAAPWNSVRSRSRKSRQGSAVTPSSRSSGVQMPLLPAASIPVRHMVQ